MCERFGNFYPADRKFVFRAGALISFCSYAFPAAALPPDAYGVDLPELFRQDNGLWLSVGIVLLLTVSPLLAFYIWRRHRVLRQSLAVFTALPLQVAVCDRKERVLFFHGGAASGKERRQTYRTLSELPDVPYREALSCIRDTLETGRAHTLEFVSAGTARTVTAMPFPGNGCFRESVILVVQDAAGRENTPVPATRTGCESEETDALWRSIVDALPVYIFAKDAERNFQYLLWNQAFTRVFDLKKPPPPRAGNEVPAEIDVKTMQEGRSDRVERFLDKSGNIRYTRTITQSFVTDGGKQLLLGAGLDITELEKNRCREAEQRRLLEKMWDHLPFAVAVKDAAREFRYHMCNRNFAHLAGREIDDILGKTDHELRLVPGFEECFLAEDRTALASDQPSHTTVNGELPGRGRVVLEKYVIPIRPEPDCELEQRHNLILEAFFDLTVRSILMENEQLLNSCLELVLTEEDYDRIILTMLEKVCRHQKADRCCLLEYDPGNRLLRARQEYHVPECAPVTSELTELKFEPAEYWFQELAAHRTLSYPNMKTPQAEADLGIWAPRLRKDGVCSLYISGIFLGDQLWGSLGVAYERRHCAFSELDMGVFKAAGRVIEITLDRRRNHSKLLEAVKEANDANRAKSFFLASMSHEIRTPLHAVIGFTELLKDDNLLPSVRKEYLNGMSTAGSALLELINDVLDLSKLEAGPMHFREERTDFGELCGNMISLFQIRQQEKKLKLISELPPLPALYLDRQRIRQILFNLLSNAVKFTERGQVTLKVAFFPDDGNRGTLQFQVKDTGIGIDPEDQKRLFEPFVQARNQRGMYTTTQGTGLGLAICRRLLERMSGTITLVSKPGHGSCFTVRIPGIRYGQAEPPVADETPSPRIKPAGPLRALVVDDVLLNRKVLKAMFEKSGISPATAASGVEALASLQHESFDLVLTDLWMPEMDGAELARQLRHRGFAGHIYAITADVESETTFDLSAFNGLLTKPLSMEKLENLIEQLTR